MEVYRSQDGQVVKYVHNDGSETAIKTVSSCGNIVNEITGNIEPTDVERNKFSVFISSSVGCPVGCKFCYLTVKKFPYHKLSSDEIYENVMSALRSEKESNDPITDKYIKFSFMGMGDTLLNDPAEIRDLSLELTESVTSFLFLRDSWFPGIDGIDISTCMPIGTKRGWQHQYGRLNDELMKFRINPEARARSPLRLFYSLHGAYPSTRRELMPNTSSDWNNKDISSLLAFRDWYGVDVIFHHIFLDGVNDGIDNVKKLIEIVKDADVELRILRYNECNNSPFKETKNFNELVKYCAEHLPRVKYQVSAGSEIKAACGQFLCKAIDK